MHLPSELPYPVLPHIALEVVVHPAVRHTADRRIGVVEEAVVRTVLVVAVAGPAV